MGTNIGEEVANVLKTAADGVSYRRSNQRKNAEMAQTVNQYKKERTAFYDNQMAAENPFSSATQTLWYQHFLHKKRLDKRGIRIRYEGVQETKSQAPENSSLPFFDYDDDGKNMVCKIKDNAYFKNVWMKDDRNLYTENSAGKKQQYYLLSSKNEGTDRYACPNCGNVDSIENMIDGCDYCGTKFRLEDFKEKVSSYYLDKKGAISTGRDKNPAALLVPLILGVMLLFGLFFMVILFLVSGVSMAAGGYGGVVLFPLLILAVLIGIVVFFALLIGGAFMIGKKSEKTGVGRTTIVMGNIKNADPLFSKEFFIGNLMNKVQSLHYAANKDEVQPFFKKGLEIALPDYSNVVDCELVDYVLTDFVLRDNLQHLSCDVTVNLKCDNNSAVTMRQEKLKLSLVKKDTKTMAAINDAIVFRCQSCGNSLTLLNGGRCESCGNGLDMIEYDWVFEGYEVV